MPRRSPCYPWRRETGGTRETYGTLWAPVGPMAPVAGGAGETGGAGGAGVARGAGETGGALALSPCCRGPGGPAPAEPAFCPWPGETGGTRETYGTLRAGRNDLVVPVAPARPVAPAEPVLALAPAEPRVTRGAGETGPRP